MRSWPFSLRFATFVEDGEVGIYRVEARLREEGAGPLDRQRARWLESRTPYDHLAKLIRRMARFRGITPRSKLGEALAYAASQWVRPEPCFMDGQIEFDNNLTERKAGLPANHSSRPPEEEAASRLAGAERRQNAIRPTKLGHKYWMFIGGEHTGWRSAVIYTFVEQVRRHGADRFAYFEWVIEKLMHNPPAGDHKALLPVNWIKARPAACQTIESRVA
jgi:transposase